MLSVLTATAAFLGPAPAVPAGSRSSAVSMMAKKIPNKQVWVPFVNAAEVKPGTINSGFKYGQEIAVICDKKGGLSALSNKMPPTGQPTTFAQFDDAPGVIVEPVTGTKFNAKTGKPIGTWCPAPLGRLIYSRISKPQDIASYPCRKSGNTVEVNINVNAKAQFEQGYWRGILDAQGKTDGGYY